MKLSRHFNELLSCSRILPGLKENLKSQELFEAFNDYLLEKEKQTKYGNYYYSENTYWYLCSNYEIERINKTNALNCVFKR